MTDKTGVLVPYSTTASQIALSDEDQADFRAYARGEKTKNTLSAYESQLKAFHAWCDQRGLAWDDRIPILPHLLAAFLNDRQKGKIMRGENGQTFPPASRSTLSIALAAIKWLHDRKRLPFIAADDRDFRAIWAGMRRGRLSEDGKHIPHPPQRQAKPLRGTELASVLSSLKGSLLDRRDAALLACAYVGALRRSELVEIDWQRSNGGLGLFSLEGDLAKITLFRSKSSQSDAVEIVIDRKLNPRAISAIENWVHLAQIEAGTPLFRRITPRRTVGTARLTPDGANRALRACMYRFHLEVKLSEGIEPDLAKAQARAIAKAYSGHSGRVGFITSAAEGGAQALDIMARSRHKSVSMINVYSRQADSLRRGRAVDQIKGVGL